MKRFRTVLMLISGIILAISAVLPAAAQVQTVPIECKDQYGKVRTDQNSVDSDFCFLTDGTMTTTSWGEYKIYKKLNPMLNSGSLTLSNPVADPGLIQEIVPFGAEGDMPITEQPIEQFPAPDILPDVDFLQLQADTPAPPMNEPQIEIPAPLIMELQTETPTPPMSEPQIETPDPLIVDLPTSEPAQEETPPVMMLSVPLIGTITDINGLNPANGSVYNTATVDFSWTFDAVGVDTVQTNFTLTIDGTSYAVTPTCGVDICNTTRTVAAGNHSWYVTATAGPITLSSKPLAFSVVLNAVLPSKPVLAAPTGAQTTRVLDLKWYPASNTDTYQVSWTYNSLTGSASLVATDASCMSGLCVLPVSFPTEANYTWQVKAVNTHGDNTSDPMTFAIGLPLTAPAKPVLSVPDGAYTSPTVNFVWKPADNAVSYAVVWVSQWGETDTLSLAANDASCLAGDCHVSDVLPSAGNYTWYVIATNSVGTSQSNPKSFSLSNQITTPVAYTPRGAVGNAQPFTYVFSKVQDNVYEYNVKVWEAYSNAQVADYYWNVSDLNCSSSTCSGLASSTLPQGYYYWKVRARTNNAVSDWSSASHYNNLTFPTPTPVPPSTVPYAYSPSGLINTATPIFSWKAITGASAYWLTIYDGYARSIYSTSMDSSVCSYGRCSVNPGFVLPANGNYSWRIAGGAWNGTVWGVSSAAFSYQGYTAQPVRTIVPQILPSDIRFVFPGNNGVMNASEAKIVWLDAFDKNERFVFEVFDKDGSGLLRTDLDRESAWCDRTICTISFETIPVAEGYRFELTPISKSGKTGNTASLTVDITDQPLGFSPLYPMQDENVSSRPIFSWRLPTGTDVNEQKDFVYTLKLDNRSQSMEAVLGPFTCESAGLTCFEGGAFLTLKDPLASAEYRWGVAAQQLDAYTDPVTFRIP